MSGMFFGGESKHNETGDHNFVKESSGDGTLNQKYDNSSDSAEQRQSRLHELLCLWKEYTKNFPLDDTNVKEIASELCSLLIKTKSFEALMAFMKNLPSKFTDCNASEAIVRAKLNISLFKKDTLSVYKLFQEHHFTSETEDLIKIWDEAHYIDEEKRTKRSLTPLARFRVRKRFPPPNSICSDGVRKTNTLKKESTTCLRTWLSNHLNDPYPTAIEKQQLAEVSGLSQRQVKTWFANARRRGKNYHDRYVAVHGAIIQPLSRSDVHEYKSSKDYNINCAGAHQNSSSDSILSKQYCRHDFQLDGSANNYYVCDSAGPIHSHPYVAGIFHNLNRTPYCPFSVGCYRH